MPVLRPLIGANKQEIIDTARDIGTYEVSIQPDQDCCSLFVPRSPETRELARPRGVAGGGAAGGGDSGGGARRRGDAGVRFSLEGV